MSSKQLAEYQHPTDYVVIPLPVRDRIMARLNAAEEKVRVLEKQIAIIRAAVATGDTINVVGLGGQLCCGARTSRNPNPDLTPAGFGTSHPGTGRCKYHGG